MNNKVVLIIGAVIVLALVGGGIFFLLNNQSQPTSDPQQIAQLVEQGQALECDVDRTDQAGRTVGKVFIDGDRVRGTVTFQAEGEEGYKADILNDGVYGYTWGETPFGPVSTKVRLDDADAEDNEVFDTEDRSDFECRPWVVTESTFNLPTDVEFTDLSEQVRQIEDATEGIKEAQCNACNQIDDASGRELCKQTLGCN